jgi:hypothetical protein
MAMVLNCATILSRRPLRTLAAILHTGCSVASNLPRQKKHIMRIRYHFIIVCGALLLVSSVGAFVVTTTSTLTATPTATTSAGVPSLSLLQSSQGNTGTTNTNNDAYLCIDNPKQQQQQHRLILAIFPLRKTVRLPTELLTLNLYEQRYLAMAEWILGMHENENENHYETATTARRVKNIFGALYTSDKTQIVKGAGLGPIVPIVQVGNIGVLFSVQHMQDDLVQTRDEQYQRRRIRLVGSGLARFRIERILHNGYDQDKNNNTDNHSPGGRVLPFIVAESSLILDEPVVDDDEEEQRIQSLLSELSSKGAAAARIQQQQQQKQDEGFKSSSSSSYSNSIEDEGEDDSNVSTTKKSAETTSDHSTEASSSSPQVQADMLFKQLVSSNKDEYSKVMIQQQQHEMQSFAIASSLLPQTSTLDRLSVLGMMTLPERLDYLNGKVIEQNKKRMVPWKLSWSGWW